jgi:hypothetical protein
MKHFKPKEAYDFLQQNPDAVLVDCYEHHQRSRLAGWRKEGLPWEQA